MLFITLVQQIDWLFQLQTQISLHNLVSELITEDMHMEHFKHQIHNYEKWNC